MADFRREYADVWYQALCDEIDHTRDANEARNRYWRMMSARNWANNEIDNLATYGLVFLEGMFRNASRNDRDEDIIRRACEEWVKLDLADFVLRDRDLCEALDDDLYRKAQDLQRDREYVMRDIKRALEAQEREDRRERDGYNSRDRDRGYSSSGREERGYSGTRFGRDRGDTRSNERRGGFASAASSNANDADQSSRSSRDRQEREPARATAPRQEEAPRRVSAKGLPARKTQLDGPDYMAARPFDEFWQDDECWRPAHKSGWTAGNQEDPFPVAYNINTHLKFHVMDKEGKVREELMNMSKDNAYLRMELQDGREIEQYQSAQRSEPLGEGNRAPGRVGVGTVDWNLYKGPAKFHDSAPTVGNMNEGDILAQFTHSTQSSSLVLHKYSLVNLITTDLSKLGAISDVANANNLTDAVEKMAACINTTDPMLWNTVNERLTEAVNHAMRNAFGVTSPKRISNFYTDYKALLDHFRKVHGESFARNFNIYTRRLVASALSFLEDTYLYNYLSGLLGTTVEELNDNRPNIAALVDFYVVATVDFSMAQLGILLTDAPVEVDQEKMSGLYAFVENLFKLTPDDIEVRSTYFLTSDRQRVEVIRSGYNANRLLIRKL